MSSLHNLRPRRGGEHQYTELDSETERETDTIAEGDTSSEDSEEKSGVSASRSDNNVNSSEARPSSSRVTTRSRRQHLPLSSRTRAPTISPTRLTDRTVNLDLARLYIESTANLQSDSNQTTTVSDTNLTSNLATNNMAEADSNFTQTTNISDTNSTSNQAIINTSGAGQNPNQNINNMSDANPNPVRQAPKRITSEPALRDVNGRAKQRPEKDLSSQSENGDSNDGLSREFDKENRVYLTPRRQLNFAQRHFMKKRLRKDPPIPEFPPPRRVEETAPVEETAQVEEAAPPEEEAEEPAPARDGLSYDNVLPEYGYGYGYDVADDDEPSCFRDTLAAIEARDALLAGLIGPSSYNDVLRAFERADRHLRAGTRTQYPEMAGETEGDDSWMEEFLNMDEFEN